MTAPRTGAVPAGQICALAHARREPARRPAGTTTGIRGTAGRPSASGRCSPRLARARARRTRSRLRSALADCTGAAHPNVGLKLTGAPGEGSAPAVVSAGRLHRAARAARSLTLALGGHALLRRAWNGTDVGYCGSWFGKNRGVSFKMSKINLCWLSYPTSTVEKYHSYYFYR